MDTTHLVTDQWPAVVQLLPTDLEQSARGWGVIQRQRRIRSGEDVVRLALMYGFCDDSLRQTAFHAALAGVVKMSDVAVLDRLRGAAPWLGHVVWRFLQDRGLKTDLARFRVRVVDATGVSEPASKGTDWRFHVGIDLAEARIIGVELTGAEGGETLVRHHVDPGEVVLGDRGYAHRAGVASVLERKAHVVVRINSHNFPLSDMNRQSLDFLALLETLQPGQTGEWEAQFEANGSWYPVRLVARRKPEQEAAREARRVSREATRKGHQPDPRSLRAAHFIAVITDLPSEVLPADEALELYRLRWQIEIVFKQLKSLMHLDHLRAKDPALAQAYLYAGLLGALIVQELCQGTRLFSPRRQQLRGEAHQPVAPAAAGRPGAASSDPGTDGPGATPQRRRLVRAVPTR